MAPTPDLEIVGTAIKKAEKPDLNNQDSAPQGQNPPPTVETKKDNQPLQVAGKAITISPRR